MRGRPGNRGAAGDPAGQGARVGVSAAPRPSGPPGVAGSRQTRGGIIRACHTTTQGTGNAAPPTPGPSRPPDVDGTTTRTRETRKPSPHREPPMPPAPRPELSDPAEHGPGDACKAGSAPAPAGQRHGPPGRSGVPAPHPALRPEPCAQQPGSSLPTTRPPPRTPRPAAQPPERTPRCQAQPGPHPESCTGHGRSPIAAPLRATCEDPRRNLRRYHQSSVIHSPTSGSRRSCIPDQETPRTRRRVGSTGGAQTAQRPPRQRYTP